MVAVLRLREVKNGHLDRSAEQAGQADRQQLAARSRSTTRLARDGAQLDYNVLARNLAVGHVLLADDAWLSTDDPAPVADPTEAARAARPRPRRHPARRHSRRWSPRRSYAAGRDPPVVSGNTLFGSSIYQESGESFAAGLPASRVDVRRLGVDRVFYPGLPKAWPGTAGYSGGPVVVSFKVSPQTVLTGAYDATLKSWFATAPRDRQIWWSYYHEPEDQIEAGDVHRSRVPRGLAADLRARLVRRQPGPARDADPDVLHPRQELGP